MNDQLDQDAYNLARAIKRKESGERADAYEIGLNGKKAGGSGEIGAYQFMPTTYKNYAQKYLGDGNAAPTVENQNKIAYSFIKEKKDAGYNPAQIASMWNAGEGEPDAYTGTFKKTGKPSKGKNEYGAEYDVPGYAAGVSKYYQEFKGSGGGATGSYAPNGIPGIPTAFAGEGTPPPAAPNPSGAWFPSQEGDNGLVAGLKTAGNLVPSAFNFAKGVVDVLNPISSANKIFNEIPAAFKDLSQQKGGALPALGAAAVEAPQQAFDSVVPKGIQQLASGGAGALTNDVIGDSSQLKEAQTSLVNDPVGTWAPVLFGARGLAKGIDNFTATRAADRMTAYLDDLEGNTNRGVPLPQGGTNLGGAMDSAISAPTKLAGSLFKKEPAQLAPGEFTPDQLQAAGKIVQGAKRDKAIAARALTDEDIDLKGAKTYTDLSTRTQKAIDKKMKTVDAEFEKKQADMYKLDELTKNENGASINYVQEALAGLRELYQKTRDVGSQRRIVELIDQAQERGLNPGEINRIAREYGTEFGDKAFRKQDGQPLTSVNAQAYENIRSGVKETARGFLDTEEARALDRQASDLIRVKTLANKMQEKVNALEQRIEKRNIVEQVGRLLGMAVDVLTLGGLKAFMTKVLFPSNVGLKQFNSLDIEANLQKNLRIINRLEKQPDSVLVRALAEGFKAINELPNTVSNRELKLPRLPAKLPSAR